MSLKPIVADLRFVCRSKGTIREGSKTLASAGGLMPSGVTLKGVKQLYRMGSDPTREKWIQKEIFSAVPIENVTRIKGLECLLNT